MIHLWQTSVQYGARALIGKLAALFIAFHVAAGGASAETITIAALGDSLTQGYGLPEAEGLVPQLQAWLDAAGEEAVVLNAGVSGDTTSGGRARIGWTLTDEVDALIVALGGNDVLRGIAPELARENLSAILQAAADRGLPVLLVGLSAPANYGPDYKAAFDAIYPELAAQYGALLFPGFLDVLTKGRDTQTVLRDLMQADAIHPNREGVALIVAEFGPAVQALIKRARARGH